MLFILRDENDFFVEAENGRGEGRVLAAQRDMHRARNVAGKKLLRRPGVEYDHTLWNHSYFRERLHFGQRRRTAAVEFGVEREISWAFRQLRRQQAHELFLRLRP